jgi:hypothetical protein
MHVHVPRILIRVIKIGVFTFATAYILAGLYVIILKMTLPPSDAAYHQSLRDTFEDPFVRSIGFTIASIFAFIVIPIAVFCLDERKWLRQGLVSSVIVAAFIAAATPFLRTFAVLGSPIVAISSLLFIRFYLAKPCTEKRT